MKKLIAALTAIAMLVSFAACGRSEPGPNPETEGFAPSVTSAPETQSAVEPNEKESVQDSATTEVQATVSEKDPSEWTNEEIIAFYKEAAAKSHPNAKSTQVMEMNELIINDGDGAIGFFIKILEPAIASVVKKNAFDFDGITGGFADLSAEDAKSIKAYKSGEYTVIEMTMKNQTDGIHADAYAGSVGHAVTVLGDVSKVLAEFPQFEVNLDDADIKVNYVNATVKVKINKNGIIEKGTWKYTCDPEIKNITISGIKINKADAKIDYIITVGGGF